MNKSVPLLPAVLLRGGFCLCLLACSVAGLAQNPAPAANVEGVPSDEAPPAVSDTEILASQGATFAAKDRIAVFSGDVRVRDPRFTLACDKLTVYLGKGAGNNAEPPTAAATPPPIDPTVKSGDANRGGGIDHAVAEGHVIIIQKHAPTKAGEEEKVSVGRADRAEYDSKTGDMTLRGMPKVEQNGDSHEALSNSTYMILHRDNSLDTHGPNRTHIAPRAKDNLPGTKPGSSPPAATPAGRRTGTSGTQN